MTTPASNSPADAIELAIFASRITAVCEEMGASLAQAAFSPNIRDRLDYSCAVFDARGRLCAQAAHIPVHLGSMAYAMADIVAARDWAPGQMIALNDPYLGGTHLPDVTLIAPLFVGDELVAFVANRAHHADIGADSPGSMPLSKSLDDEGLVIAPVALVELVELQFWWHADSETAGATKVSHFESGVRAVHDACVSSYHCGFDQWMDHHYAYDGVAVPEEVIAERATSALLHEIEPPRLDPRHLRRRGEAVQEHDRNRRFARPDAHDGP